MQDFARWHDRWQTGELGWHRQEPHGWLVEHASASWRRVLVPLCGASVDLGWLADRGAEVVGVELSEVAAARVFSERGEEATREVVGEFVRYRAGSLTVLVGDYLALTPAVAGTFDAVWDRAALVAIPPELRATYAATTLNVAPGAEMLVVVLEYSEDVMDGPPFAISNEVIAELYPDLRLLKDQDISAEFAERGRVGKFVRKKLYGNR